ncbi:MAG TPA: cysteine--tRNA ligase, partial [Armatimonadetes bacterium]|nr:cysteine--tRNA ligase [Armatimonadota bacterium]
MLRLYNTLKRRVEEFKPRDEEEGRVTIYVCGLTPYDYTHVGHARTYIAYDILRRYLEFRGYKVFHVQNFTDIDDKIIARAKEEGKDPFEVAEFYSEAYLEDMDRLGVLRAHLYPKVTEHIPQIIEAVQALIDKGHAYVLDGDVYFDVTSFPGYGKLSGKNPEELLAGARVEPKPGKRHPLDFALWKGAKEGEPSWESPWGRGRPGWHIECSVMSVSYLGMGFDIHGGAIELSFPHHENEIAQSEAWTGKSPFVRYWVHTGLVTIGGEKMSKSLGNIVTVREALERHEPDALRMLFLRAHYRQPIDFTWEALEEAGRALRRLRIALEVASKESEGPPREGDIPLEGLAEAVRNTRRRFIEAMDEDLGTPEALGA